MTNKTLELLKVFVGPKDAGYAAQATFEDEFLEDACIYCRREAMYKHGRMNYSHAIDCIITETRKHIRELENEDG